VAIERYFIIDAVTGKVTLHSASTQAYTHHQYRALLAECGFDEVMSYASLDGSPGEAENDLTVLLSRSKQVGQSQST
jgi:hypothetical protein